jgi:hypothetical protein
MTRIRYGRRGGLASRLSRGSSVGVATFEILNGVAVEAVHCKGGSRGSLMEAE